MNYYHDLFSPLPFSLVCLVVGQLHQKNRHLTTSEGEREVPELCDPSQVSDCSSPGDHKPHFETEKSVEFGGVEYGDLKGFCVDLKAFGNRLDLFCPE